MVPHGISKFNLISVIVYKPGCDLKRYGEKKAGPAGVDARSCLIGPDQLPDTNDQGHGQAGELISWQG